MEADIKNLLMPNSKDDIPTLKDCRRYKYTNSKIYNLDEAKCKVSGLLHNISDCSPTR